MKRLFLAAALLLCLSFAACSNTESNHHENNVKTESTEPQAVPVLDYTIQTIPSETMDPLSANEFRWGGRGIPTLCVKWIGEDELLFFTYRSDPDITEQSCRLFSYTLSSNTLTQLIELSGEGTFDITCFRYGNSSYLLWNHPYFPQLSQLNAQTTQIEPFMGTISPTGELAVTEWESPVVLLKDFLDKEAQPFQFQKNPLEEFVSWSPDGQHLAFYQSENKQYTIYDRQGNLKQSVLAEQFHWCEEPGFFTVRTQNGNENRWKLFHIVEGTETPLPAYPEGNILVQEPGFALIEQSTITLINHKTGESIPIEVNGFENSVLVFTDYYRETGTVALACWMEAQTEDGSIEQWPACSLVQLYCK